jgi:hypothetical protein
MGNKYAKHVFRTGKQETLAEWMATLKTFLSNQQIELTDKVMKKFSKQQTKYRRKHGHFKKASSIL